MEGRENIEEIEEKQKHPVQRLRYRNQSARWSDHNYDPNCPPTQHNVKIAYVCKRQTK